MKIFSFYSLAFSRSFNCFFKLQVFGTNFFRIARVDGVHVLENFQSFLLLANRQEKLGTLRKEAQTDEIEEVEEAAAEQVQPPRR